MCEKNQKIKRIEGAKIVEIVIEDYFEILFWISLRFTINSFYGSFS